MQKETLQFPQGKITSFEIAEYMIRTRSILSAKELTQVLKPLYPNLVIDCREVYYRLRAIAGSKYSSAVIYEDERPRKFRIMSIDAEFFRRSRGQRRFSATLINELSMSYEDKEEREHLPYRDSRHLFNQLVRPVKS